jgi:hypothetical protein
LCSSELKEVILAHGHENIKATHKTTLEITKESWLSKRGNCVVGVSANKAIKDLNIKLKQNLTKNNAKIKISIEAGEFVENINAFGSSRLILTHPTDLVIRRSSYVCKRTLAIQADKAACNLSRALVNKMENPEQLVKITLTIKP